MWRTQRRQRFTSSAIATATRCRCPERVPDGSGAERPNDHLEETQTFATEADVDSVSGTISSQSIHQAVLRLDDHDIDLVVGTRGRMGFDRYVLESVTEHLVRTSPKTGVDSSRAACET